MKWARTRAIRCALAAAIATVAALAQAPAASAATCGDYANQRDAQRAADTRDADSDGVYCESLPCPCARPRSGGERRGGGSGRSPATTARRFPARVVSVTDGDTLEVRALPRGPDLAVRIIGIDTPEVYGGVECGGREASASMRRLAAAGSRVRLRTDPSQDRFDRYGRLLAYVSRGGNDLGLAQVRRGWASVYVFEAPFRRLARYLRVESRTERLGRGVFGLCSG